MGKKMQFDVTLNATFEVDADTFAVYLEDAEGDKEAAMNELINFNLDGEEISTTEGRCWICQVDDCSRI